MAFKPSNNRPNRNSTSQRALDVEQDEYEGLWLNVGINREGDEEGTERFVRFNRGIAVSDLKDNRVYAGSSEEYAADSRVMNQVLAMIRRKGLTLEEGEGVEINLTVQLYRRQEQVDQVGNTSAKEDAALEESLFG